MAQITNAFRTRALAGTAAAGLLALLLPAPLVAAGPTTRQAAAERRSAPYTADSKSR